MISNRPVCVFGWDLWVRVQTLRGINGMSEKRLILSQNKGTKAGKRVEEFGSSVTAFFCPSTVPHQNTSRTHSIISSPVQCVSFYSGQRLNFLKFHFCTWSSWATDATLRMNAFEKCFDILQLFCRWLIFDQFCLRTTR